MNSCTKQKMRHTHRKQTYGYQRGKGSGMDWEIVIDIYALNSENEDHGIRSHCFMGNRWGNSGNSVRLYMLGSKITADGDCSHEIKRRLLLGRKVMTNLDSIFKSRDITLLTKVCLVKGMVFPIVMYGCESWTVKRAECRRIDAFEVWCWRRLLRVPWTLGFLWKEWC